MSNIKPCSHCGAEARLEEIGPVKDIWSLKDVYALVIFCSAHCEKGDFAQMEGRDKEAIIQFWNNSLPEPQNARSE